MGPGSEGLATHRGTCAAAGLSQIYHPQFNPTISFLREPVSRSLSLVLGIKPPLLLDHTIFGLLNNRRIQPCTFVPEFDGWLLKEEAGRKTVVRVVEEHPSNKLLQWHFNQSLLKCLATELTNAQSTR
jgi:CRISPR/Cas system-associated endonuclease Cas1